MKHVTDNNDNIIDQPVIINPAAEKVGFPSEQDIISVLSAVEDPELHMNIVELGLIYRVDRDEAKGTIEVDMTLTTPACPYGPQLFNLARTVLGRLPKVKSAKINPVFIPPWDPRKHASETAKMVLGII